MELFYHNTWQTLCPANWDGTIANVSCKAMGYSYAEKMFPLNPVTRNEKSPPWKLEVSCQGGEAALKFCMHDKTVVSPCKMKEIVGLKCLSKCKYNLLHKQYMLCDDYTIISLQNHREPTGELGRVTSCASAYTVNLRI